MPRIAVLGGTGYLASILRNYNNIKKNRYIFFSRKKNSKNYIKYYSFKRNLDILKNFDIIIHLSGPNQNQLKKNLNLIKKKSEFTKRICDFCIKYKIKLIYLSSMQVYKDYGNKNISINSMFNLNNPYSKSHYSSERIINSKFLNNKNMYTILRVGNVFGLKKCENIKEIKNNLIHNFCYLALKNMKISVLNGSIHRTFIPSKIFMEVISRVIRKNFFKNSVINIFYKNLSLSDLAQIIKKRSELILNLKVNINIKNSGIKKNFLIYPNKNFNFHILNKKIYNEIDQILKLIKKKFN